MYAFWNWKGKKNEKTNPWDMLGRFRFGIPNLKEHETTFLNLDIDHHILLFGKILLTKHDLWWGHWDFVAVCPTDQQQQYAIWAWYPLVIKPSRYCFRFKCTIARGFSWISHCHVWHRRLTAPGVRHSMESLSDLSDPHPQLAFVCEGIPIRMLQRKISKCPQSTWVCLLWGIYPLVMSK